MGYEILKVDFSEYHKNQWLWTGKNPEKTHRDWPEFEINGGRIDDRRIKGDFFPCAAVMQAERTRLNVTSALCQKCLVRWPDNLKNCSTPESLLAKYKRSEGKQRSYFADMIAAVEWPKQKIFRIHVLTKEI